MISHFLANLSQPLATPEAPWLLAFSRFSRFSQGGTHE